MSRFWAVLPPEVVFVPSEPVVAGAEQVGLVLRQVTEGSEQGSLVLPAYSTPAALVSSCGPDQPWVALRAEVVDELAEQLGVSAVVLDVAF